MRDPHGDNLVLDNNSEWWDPKRPDLAPELFRFKSSWDDRCKGLWALKNHKIELPHDIAREMIMFM